MRKFYFLLLLCFFVLTVNAQDKTFKTYTYFEEDTISLELDLFMPEQLSGEKLPLLIYIHGGGFSQGNRTAGHTLCRYLSERGFAAATISYTLYMKGKSFGCDGELAEKVKAIQIAASQLYQATLFFLNKADEFQVDKFKIFIAGSSAGAEAVLQAAFWDNKKMNLYKDNLPSAFRYAGVVSGAGAIMDLNFIQPDNVIPIMMFHGTDDKLVPYATASHHYCPPNSPGWLMFFGSSSIFNYVNDLGGTTQLYTFKGSGHEKAGAFFYQDNQYVFSFLSDVLAGKQFQNHVVIMEEKK